MQLEHTVLIVSSDLDVALNVAALKAKYDLQTWSFVFLLEDYLGEAREELKRPENFLVSDFAIATEVEAALDKIARHYSISTAVAFDEFSLYVAASANERWQLPGITREEAQRFRDKKKMKEIAQRAGIRTAREITLDEIKLGQVQFPIIVKPRSLAGAQGVRIITEADEMSSIDIDSNPEYQDMSKHQYLIETYNPACIYHIDCIVRKGTLAFLSVGEYLGKPMDFLQEKPVGVIAVPEEMIENIWRHFTEAVIAAFDAPDGVYHIEAFAGAELLEIAYRPGGAAIVEMIEMVYGLDLKLIHLAAQLGLEPSLDIQRKAQAFGYMTFPKKHLSLTPLYVTQVSLPPLENLPTLSTHSIPKAGDVASGEFYCYKDSLGSFVFCGDRDLVLQDIDYLNRHYSVAVAAEP
ncbi:serine kinase [Pseudomonas oryzihabitans]|uniref:ATP-grasp domain-containing protein n=1 Tax=Pseudomonas oryzihabitans TaxID=47885 RepID=UPI0005C87641|nr:serine kinase [Pseudomonas oryzihabitans]KIZ50360.1 serine kinase [Pseudomonas oryzihabitans]